MRAVFNATVGEVAKICGGRILCGGAAARLASVVSDSREAETGCLFVALAGERFDGHNFVDSVASQGLASAVLVERPIDVSAKCFASVAVILCDDTRAALSRIAAFYRSFFNPRVAAVTGTNGKTTVKELLYAVLSKRFKTHKSEKNYNNDIGVPFAVLGLAKEHEAAIFELGMNHAGEISRLSRVVKPDIAVITNAGEGHLEFLKSVENVARAKAEIIDGLAPGGLLILNRDSDCFEIMQSAAVGAGFAVKTFGLDSRADVFPASYRAAINSCEITLNGTVISAPLYGVHNIYNLLAVAAAAFEFGFTASETASSLASFKPVDGRSAVIDKGYIVINDTYNSNPLSSRAAIDSVKEVFPKRRKIAALGDMRELGEAAAEYHREIGAYAAEVFDMLCVCGEMASEYLAGAAGKNCALHAFASKDEMSAYLKKNIGDDDVILVKGSRSTKMEYIVESLIK